MPYNKLYKYFGLILIMLSNDTVTEHAFAQKEQSAAVDEAIMSNDIHKLIELQSGGYNISEAPDSPPRHSGVIKYTPLSMALCFRNEEIARYLLNQKINVNATNSDGSTALLCAVQKWEAAPEMVKLLIDKGAYLDSRSKDGTSVLNSARLTKERKIVQLLLRNGAADPFSDAVLWFPQSRGSASGEKTLLYGIAYGNSATTTLVSAVGDNSFEKVKELISSGVDINKADSGLWRSRPLTIAALRNCTNIVVYLLDHGADINAQNQSGSTPLMESVAGFECSLEITKILLSRGADVNARDATGCTALDYAVLAKNAEAIQLLTTAIKNH